VFEKMCKRNRAMEIKQIEHKKSKNNINFYETEIREKREKKKKREPCNDMAGADRSDGGLESWQ
jgi:hypothetical protein